MSHEAARRALATFNTSASRATFLAGYAYYEIGRYSHTANLVAYPISLSFSFALAVLSAGTAGIVSYYISQLGKHQQGACAVRLAALRLDRRRGQLAIFGRA